LMLAPQRIELPAVRGPSPRPSPRRRGEEGHTLSASRLPLTQIQGLYQLDFPRPKTPMRLPMREIRVRGMKRGSRRKG
jgi:hypothetical protein